MFSVLCDATVFAFFLYNPVMLFVVLIQQFYLNFMSGRLLLRINT